MNIDSFARYVVRMDGVEMGVFSSDDMAQLFADALRRRYVTGVVAVWERTR